MEILTAKPNPEGSIKVACNCLDIFEGEQISYVGGILEFKCKSISIFDESKKEISLDFVKERATKYWEDFSKS
ncbi:hypothetical protein [Bernardetia sp.]|uniref:hypothetical protein n=1 Tax=Bernardetia sp. TaxID=1937974 RepID=UPI0025BE120D|nr:hypothetical protein [Bernardetia sp.]